MLLWPGSPRARMRPNVQNAREWFSSVKKFQPDPTTRSAGSLRLAALVRSRGEDPANADLCSVRRLAGRKACELFRRDRTIERTLLAIEIPLEVVDAFAGQPAKADRMDHSIGGGAANFGHRKIAFGVTERHPRPLGRNKKPGCLLVVLQAVRDLPVEHLSLASAFLYALP